MEKHAFLWQMDEDAGCKICSLTELNEIHNLAHDIAKDTNPKDAIGCTKPPLSVVSMPVVYEVGLGMLEGSCKYRRHNYRVYGVRASIYFDATMRHLSKWWEGEDIDPDSNLSHITKALASLFVLRDAMIQDMWHDDRPPITRPEFWAELEIATKNVLARFPNPKPPHTEKEESEKERAKQPGPVTHLHHNPDNSIEEVPGTVEQCPSKYCKRYVGMAGITRMASE